MSKVIYFFIQIILFCVFSHFYYDSIELLAINDSFLFKSYVIFSFFLLIVSFFIVALVPNSDLEDDPYAEHLPDDLLKNLYLAAKFAEYLLNFSFMNCLLLIFHFIFTS